MKKYTIVYIVTVASLLSCIGLFNYRQDPYGIFGFTPPRNTYIAKAYGVIRNSPQILILGTSRPEYALSPTSEVFHGRGKVYNLSLSGSNIYEVLRYLQHATYNNSVKEVILLLDYTQFNSYKSINDAGLEQRLCVDKEFHPKFYFTLDKIKALISYNAIKESITNYTAINSEHLVSYSNQLLGQSDPITIFKHRKTFGGILKMSKVQEKIKIQATWNPTGKGYSLDKGDGQRPFSHFKNIVQHCHNLGITIRMAFSPIHARMLTLMYQSGHWSTFEQWKQGVIHINEAVARELGKKPFHIFDFAGNWRINNDKIPASSSESARYWWETVHFNFEVGEIVLKKLYGLPVESLDASDFGAQVTEKNIEEHLNNVRKLRAAYMTNNPDIVRDILLDQNSF